MSDDVMDELDRSDYADEPWTSDEEVEAYRRGGEPRDGLFDVPFADDDD